MAFLKNPVASHRHVSREFSENIFLKEEGQEIALRGFGGVECIP
jgi:hypothetical protein